MSLIDNMIDNELYFIINTLDKNKILYDIKYIYDFNTLIGYSINIYN